MRVLRRTSATMDHSPIQRSPFYNSEFSGYVLVAGWWERGICLRFW